MTFINRDYSFCHLYRDIDRNKAIKLLLKIYKNIINNPKETKKYGDLHFGKIKQKLSKCQPAMDLLLLSGFKKSNNDTRLIWTDENDNKIVLLNHIQTKLKSMINDDTFKSTKVVHTEISEVCHKIYVFNLMHDFLRIYP